MKVVIVGGAHAAVACAIKTRTEYPDSEIVLYERQKSIGFAAQNIPRYLLGHQDFSYLFNEQTKAQLENLKIQVFTQTVVVELNLGVKKLKVFDLYQELEEEVTYDKLVLAMGSSPSLPLAQGYVGKNFFIIKRADEAEKLKKFMQEAHSVLIVGGGAIGTELAQVMSARGIETTLLHSSSHLLHNYLDEAVSDRVRKSLEESGVTVFTDEIVHSITEEADEQSARKSSHIQTQKGKQFVADGVIYATGFLPNSFLVAEQLDLGDKGAIVVNDYLQTSQEDVFAVGDCATTQVKNMKTARYLSHASDALRQGEIAALNLRKPQRKIPATQSTYKFTLGSRHILAVTGLNLAKAQSEGFAAAIVSIRDVVVDTHDYVDSWLVYEKKTHKILGYQCFGNVEGIAEQADLISLAIQNDMSIESLEYSDFHFRTTYNNPQSFVKRLADEVRIKER